MVNQDGRMDYVLLQSSRDAKAVKRFLNNFSKKYRNEPRKILTDKLRNDDVATENLPRTFLHQQTITPTLGTS